MIKNFNYWYIFWILIIILGVILSLLVPNNMKYSLGFIFGCISFLTLNIADEFKNNY